MHHSGSNVHSNFRSHSGDSVIHNIEDFQSLATISATISFPRLNSKFRSSNSAICTHILGNWDFLHCHMAVKSRHEASGPSSGSRTDLKEANIKALQVNNNSSDSHVYDPNAAEVLAFYISLGELLQSVDPYYLRGDLWNWMIPKTGGQFPNVISILNLLWGQNSELALFLDPTQHFDLLAEELEGSSSGEPGSEADAVGDIVAMEGVIPSTSSDSDSEVEVPLATKIRRKVYVEVPPMPRVDSSKRKPVLVMPKI
ncbi:hypothetical protein B0H16DRAFT_1452505 [Mycena metata]|uniref:Uncharacterized protein n=1 Tax=Mycena metata TaxID=1033252 RepID=A0AAD7NNU7_9AGAR|nr:hypothetical protein B0H16DRAFT_1452505 [Mycena metata]